VPSVGAAISEPVVVPQSDGTVVPKNETVVPTVVPQNTKSNVTITSIIVVLVIFIGAGIVGILLLRNSKASVAIPEQTTQIAINDLVNTTIPATTTTKAGGWVSTTTTTRVDGIENSYTVNGLKINIPDGYTPSYTNEVLTVVAPNGKDYYLINVITGVFEAIDQNKYQSELIKAGYEIGTFEPGTYTGRNGIKMDIKYTNRDYRCYIVKANGNKVAFFVFDPHVSSEYVDNIINYSLM